MRKKVILLSILIGLSYLNAEELSAFKAGDINSPTPYGLSDSEKVVLKNKQQMNELTNQINILKAKMLTTDEQIDGIRSVLDGTNELTNNLNNKLKKLDKNDANETQIEQIYVYMNERKKQDDENNDKIKKVIEELSSLIDSINSNYVPKSQYLALEKRVKNLETNTKYSSSLDKLSGKVLLDNGEKFYNENNLDEAKKYFEKSSQKNYKRAFSNFMLGEISYKQKDWENAIAYYKISVKTYDKASYMPKLLYHTAISFDKIGKQSDANGFYKALKANYPNSKEAKASPNRK